MVLVLVLKYKESFQQGMDLSNKFFLAEVEKFTSNPVQRKDDLEKIVDVIVNNDKEEEFEKLTFTAKYICGLMRVLKTAPGVPEVTNIDYVKNDLNENIKKAIEQLKSIISLSTESDQEHFDKNYFILTQQNLTNLSQLFSDLESVKKYLNHVKRLT